MIVTCPHCKQYVWIEEINCGIFRHGVYKMNGEQLPPHASKEVCNIAFEKNQIYGCGKPFRIVNSSALICDYI